MIRTFSDPETERIWNGERSRRLPPDIQQRAMRRLTLLDTALSLDELGARIAVLRGEIARVEAHLGNAAAHRSAADELFKAGKLPGVTMEASYDLEYGSATVELLPCLG